MQAYIAVSINIYLHQERTNQGLSPYYYRAIKMLSQREDIDLEKELHKVYKMFEENQAKLISMKGRGDP